jgi:hypothetical protein
MLLAACYWLLAFGKAGMPGCSKAGKPENLQYQMFKLLNLQAFQPLTMNYEHFSGHRSAQIFTDFFVSY